MRARAAATAAVVMLAALVFLHVRSARAHCDTLDGPVVTAARQALETGNINHALPWVAPADEAELREAFAHARRVRALGDDARELADRSFFETVVRVHRQGEGAPYTGLKPAGAESSPALKAADGAVATGSADALTALLEKAVREGVAAQFAEAQRARVRDVNDVAARRRGVHAYVEFVHYVEGIAAAAAGPAAQHDTPVVHAEPAAHGHE